jgi:hypothetical protein
MTDKKYHRSPSLKVKREWLELHFQKSVNVKSIADDYGYPVHTVYRVLNRMDPNRKERTDKGKKQKSPAIDVDFEALNLQGESYETQIEIMIQEILKALSKKKSMAVQKVLSYTNQLVNALKKLRSIQFAQMAKNLDVKIVEQIIRRYDPDVTDLRIIEIVREIISEIKMENKE